jgi:hypothetical protein
VDDAKKGQTTKATGQDADHKKLQKALGLTDLVMKRQTMDLASQFWPDHG